MEVNIDIEFESNLPPASFPSNSCIALRVEDISIVDAPSQLLGEIKIPVENLDPKQPLTFKLFSDKPDEDATDVAAAATLHLGHCSGQLKTGDYITDTNYVLNITEKTKSVHDIRILLKKFGKLI